MSQGEDQSPLSPSLHHSDSVPNIFSQINEYAKLESLAKKTCSPQGSAQKSVEGNTICTSVISNLQHLLNLSNISSRAECIQGTTTLTDSNCWQKPQLRLTNRDHENNQIMSDGGLNLSITSDECEVPAKKPKLLLEGVASEMEHYSLLYQSDRLRDMKACKESHREHLTELFFLQNGGNLMDYFSWKKRPNNLLACYLFSEKLDNDDISSNMEISKIDSCPASSPNALQSSSQKLSDHMSSSFTGFNVMSPCTDNAFLSYSQSTPDLLVMSTSTPSSTRHKLAMDWGPLSTGADANFFYSTATASHASMSSESSSSAVAAASAAYETSQEAIAELAKQEAQVMEKIMELRKKGLWSVRRISKAAEPAHAKAHWDYVMEEMQWLAADFGQERKAKKAGARKIARMVVRHFQEQQQKEVKAEKEDALKLKRIASNLAKCVKEFWSNIEKVVQYKQQSRLEEKRRKALDMHLSFIVDQTEKYSTWLTEGLGASLVAGGQSSQPTEANSVASSESNVDEDFKPNQDSDDDEETIEKEEQDLDEDKTAEEVAALQKEGEMSFEEFLGTLPKEVLSSATGVNIDKPKKEDKDQDEAAHSDADSYMPSEDSTDDEETLEEQEKQENVNHSEELHDLQKESEMPIEELLKMYQGTCDEKSVMDELSNDSDKNSSDEARRGNDSEKEDDEKEEEEEEGGNNDKDSEVGTEFLLKKEEVPVKQEEIDKSGPGKEINDIAATALSIQPTGYTLETAHVKTAVPFLLKHSLREYQHVGLDWLATMYDQRLNGILADEMGLGKTIQTIALLGFLACEKGIWGPHLIVVPTSVMLNWEMEIKKWCPAFKILTYYGNLKERKAKRQGWTKTNAFHVCITSYKLVIQDHQAFRRKKWKYFILDEAQNIKNFKSQRWQTLLNFHSQRRLLLTGTPLQNNLMELWSLMHFLMPHVFASHREFKEWFSNPLTGMIEGSMEYNESLVKRLHKVLRPFLLRRLKQDVEKQMPKKYEHVIMCRLSKRQRFLYDDFMSQAKTKETLATGHFMSVINILMQLRKVCNHPNLFDPRPIVSPFHMEGITLHFPSLAARALERNPFDSVDFTDIHPNLCDSEISLTSLNAKRIGELRTKRPLIVEIDSLPDPAPRLKPLPDGTQLVVTFPLESDDPSSAVQKTEGSLDTEAPFGNAGVPAQVEAEQPVLEKDIIVADKEKQSPLYMESLERKRRVARKTKLEAIHRFNQRHCSFSLVYGKDLLDAVDCIKPRANRNQSTIDVGYVQCLNARSPHERRDRNLLWESTRHLAEIILTPEEYLRKLNDILHRFVFVIPPATAPRSVMHLSHPSPSARNQQITEEFLLQKKFLPRMNCLHNIIKNQRVQFPELRLIQYDCGKLQTMDILLRRLKTEGHRVLVFTQMTRMLDVLEAFLNFHGHRYLRLDGTTKVEQRQALMERFNMDQRIFCFILSTRSGGIGVNLTGADTVIFYDSDWNPTMDAQAQDRCHRIGQTRDVHIYRLISEKTVEENILKKANEKRLLGNVAIEGGNFTTAFFKQQTIKDLFEEPSGLESLVTDDSKTVTDEAPAAAETGGLNEELIEQALCAAEDETDIQAVKVARAEQKAELAEFDETQPWDEGKADQDVKKETDDPSSNVEVELALLEKDLTPVERYAVSFMEVQLAPITNEELMKAEEEVGLAKEEWELSHLKALKQEEERRAELEEDEMLYTSLHYTAWKQQPKLQELDESFGEVLVHRKYKGVGRPSNEMRLERRNLNGMKRSVSPADSWEDSNLSANVDDSKMSSSSISTTSSLVRPNHANSAAKLKKPTKRPKVVPSLVVKVVRKNSSGKSSQSSPSDTPRPAKVPKKLSGKPPKRSLKDDSDNVLMKKRRKKAMINADVPQFTTETTASAVATTTFVSRTVAVTTASTTPPKPRPISVTKLLDSKRYLTSHGQRIIVQRLDRDATTTVPSQPLPKPSPTLATTAKDQFENKPIPILEKLSAAVMTCSVATPLNPCRTSTVISKTTIATTAVFPSHLHVSRLNQIVSSISQNVIQNASLAQSTPGTIQYFLRPSNVVSGSVRTENLVIANSGVQQATITHPTQGTSFVLVPQSLGKSSRLIVPTVANQASKQSVLILPNTGKQNYIVAQQSGNRPGYILIPNNAAQQNFILTAAASSGNVLPASQMSTPAVGATFSAPSPKVVSSFPLLQTQQVQVARQIVSPGLAVGSQQSVPVVQTGISNTVPILEKLAMQLSGANVAGMSQQQQQYRARIVPSSSIVQSSPKPSELVRLGQLGGNIVSARPSGSTVIGQLPSGSSTVRQTTGLVPSGKISGGIVTKQVARQSPVSLLSGNNTFSQSSTGSLVSRLSCSATLPGQSSGMVLTGKPIQPMNVTQFIVNQPRSHISVDKLTQLAVNGQLLFVDGRHGQELVTRGSTGPANANMPKK